MRNPRSNYLARGKENTCDVRYKAIGVPQAEKKIMRGRYKVPGRWRCTFGYTCSGPSLPGTNMHMLFPFKSVCASFVDLRPFGVISYSVTSSRTILTKSSNPSRVPVNSWSFFITTHMREPMHLSMSSGNKYCVDRSSR